MSKLRNSTVIVSPTNDEQDSVIKLPKIEKNPNYVIEEILS